MIDCLLISLQFFLRLFLLAIFKFIALIKWHFLLRLFGTSAAVAIWVAQLHPHLLVSYSVFFQTFVRKLLVPLLLSRNHAADPFDGHTSALCWQPSLSPCFCSLAMKEAINPFAVTSSTATTTTTTTISRTIRNTRFVHEGQEVGGVDREGQQKLGS